MTTPESPDKAEAEDERFLSKSHSAQIDRLAAPFRRAGCKWNSFILDTWMWEIVSITFSTLCLAAIVGIILFYDQKKTPSFPHGLTLNAIISILATCSKSALLCMIGTSVGQLKWLWFSGRTDRPLNDLQSFDDATRGPALAHLAWGPDHGRSLAFDPFTQKILRFPVRQAPSASSIATAKQTILPWIPGKGYIKEAMLNMIETGIWSEGFELDAVCPSGNCTWPPFPSAGWCSKCDDVASQATLVGCDITSFNFSRQEDQTVPCKITFPDGSWINSDVQGFWNETIRSQALTIPAVQVTAVNGQPWGPYRWGPYLNQSIFGVYSPASAFAFVELEISNGSIFKTYPVELLQKKMNVARATECVLSPCVRTYNVSITGGVLSTQTSLPAFGEIFHPDDYPGRDSLLQQSAFHSEEEFEKATACWKPERGGSVDVMLTEETWPIMSNLWDDNTKFAGCPVTDYLGFCDIAGMYTSQFVYNVSEQTWRRTHGNAPEVDTTSANLYRIYRSNLAYVMENIAASMTQYAQNLSNQTAHGTVYEIQTYVSVDWAFLALPAVLIVLGIVFLALAIRANSREALGLWKSSLLPVIYHGLAEMEADEFARVSWMERKAQQITVKLEVVDAGKRRLMVQNE